ncbi:right-handed parallel beta-helix repeat-containing protein [Parapedobacter sp. 10938]|uniref:right-handed parallel beta-helix repeat-containing protein n=1 Tax=Parapedobacter flavus TaxID=3110225 RepID=UPI002DBB9AF5|nr:right-handed parallel beta-helix repeat-containing protein [Parapedobacter sp. 10938]MEC3881233.1 right-handed parallel beta-helix repeat-containing protein [Parapedobacter sp. 10938]
MGSDNEYKTKMKERMDRLCFVWLLVVSITACGGETRSQADLPTLGTGKRINVMDYGAVGDGNRDDSEAIQRAVDSAGVGDTVYLPKGTYLVRSIRLVSNVHVVADGLLKQSAALSAPFAVEQQHSPAPLFRAHRISNVYLSVRAETVNEAIYASQCSNITVADSHFGGDSTNRRSFPAVLWYDCSASRVVGTTISHYGSARQSTETYHPGTAIRVLSSSGITIANNHLHHNGENGVFIHDSEDVEIDGNHIHHNGMSGIQVAFNAAERVANYRITNNRLEHNAADAVDINNRAHGQVVAINALIAGNYSYQNGSVNGKSTPDGSGIGTLIGVSGVTLSGNRAFGNNRPALYIEGCGDITANRNVTDGAFELVGRWEHIRMEGNTFRTLRLLANASGALLDIRHGQIDRVMLPNGIQIDSLRLMENEIASGPINVNMDGYFKFEGNRLTSGHESGALLLVKVAGASLLGNHIFNTKNAAITVRKTALGVRIDSNFVTSGGTWIHDFRPPDIKINKNKVRENVNMAEQR